MNIQLSDHFSYRKLLRFTLPTIIMMIITSIYGVVDGLFVSNLVGAEAFTALNLIMPFVMIFSSVGFMLGTGGSALVAKIIGEGDTKKGNEIFSMLVYVISGFSIVGSAFAIIYLRPIASMLGATGNILELSVIYGRVLLLALPFFMLQVTFQMFFVVAERPDMGLKMSIAAGITNVVLDFLFMGVLHWGIVGAAAATAISQVIGGIIPLTYFLRKNNSVLRITKVKWDVKALLKSCTNGSSEMMTNMSMSIVNILYNFQLIKIAGVNGVAAYGIIMYISFIFVGVFIGFSIGSAPIISYHYGANNRDELKSVFKKSVVIITMASIIMLVVAEIFAMPLAKIFVGYDLELLKISTRALRIFSISFIFTGINMFASSFFTALNNGSLSALISFLRTLVFQVLMILLLPIVLGLDGIWLAVVAAEVLTLGVTLIIFVKNKERYHYL